MENVRKAALLGLGTVGGGVYQVISELAAEMPHKIGAKLTISKILVRSLDKKREGIDPALLTDRWEEILSDTGIDIVIEVMGGIEPAKTYITEALRAGKHVVTANKDLIAEYGQELLALAAENKCDLLFEAAVAGGIPIIRPLSQCLVGNNIHEVMGIINGTTNFILTKMSEENMEFDEALALATELGYAEADPTADIEGLDAGRKLAIMASIAFHTNVRFSDVFTEGISHITSKDIRYAEEMGYEIKLLGVARNTEDGVEARVHPMLLPTTHPLAFVKDSFNGVFVHGDAVGDTMFYGRGAGALPTASAVAGDVIDVARNIQFGCTGRIGEFAYKQLPIKDISTIRSCYYLRMQVEDKAGALASFANVFGEHRVSISKLVQRTRSKGVAEIVIITDNVIEKNFQDSMDTLRKMPIIRKISSVMRVYNE